MRVHAHTKMTLTKATRLELPLGIRPLTYAIT
jgi:hypothetical protein